MGDLGLETLVLVKPKAFTGVNKKSAEAWFQADQRVLRVLKEGFIDKGEEQLKAKTGYTNEKIPDRSPTDLEPFILDGIKFEFTTTVRRNNPEYRTAFDKIMAFLETITLDWESNVRKDGVRTYENPERGENEPYLRWDYLMGMVYWHISRVTKLGVENKFKEMNVPEELVAEIKELDRLVIPVKLIEDFSIDKAGAAALWYKAGKFYEQVQTETAKPFEKELEKRADADEQQRETTEYWEQVAKYLFKVQTVASPRAEYAKVLDLLFAVPEKRKPEGSKELPVVTRRDNYQQSLEAFREDLPKALKRWKKFDGNIGELVIFYYGIEPDNKVREQFPYLPQYDLRRDEDKMFISIPTLYARMAALHQDFMKNRLLHRHSAVPIV